MLLNKLKKSSAEFGVSIENGAARERERERESLKQLIESQVFRGSRNNGKREGKGVL
jgi:hypothetical protein